MRACLQEIFGDHVHRGRQLGERNAGAQRVGLVGAVEVIPLAGDDDLVDLGRRLLLRGTLGVRRRLAGVAATKTSWSQFARRPYVGPLGG